MTIQEIEKWAKENVADQNVRTSLLLAIDTVYSHSEERITDIETFYKWFKEKYEECYEITQKGQSPINEKTVYRLDCTPIMAYRILCDTWLTKTFNIKLEDFLEENGRNIERVYFKLQQYNVIQLPDGKYQTFWESNYTVAYHICTPTEIKVIEK